MPLRVFISSPGDVGFERDLCSRVIDRLQGEFGAWFELDEVRWESGPMRATDTFQPQIVPPSQTDIVICILWSRLGTPLPEQFRRPDGSRYESGTEWEFEDALNGYREHGTPDLLVYRRDAEPIAGLRDKRQWAERLEQYEKLEAFVRKWFFSADGSARAALKTYHTPDAFETLVENDLHKLLADRLPQHVTADDGAPLRIRWHQGSPFRGLEAFDESYAPVFAGRSRAISDIREALIRRADAGCAFLLTFGMSGCGKSSLLRAGVIATLTRPGVVENVGLWRRAILRPSDAPGNLCSGLAAALLAPDALPELSAAGVALEQLGAMLAEAPEHASVPLGMALKSAAAAAGATASAGEPRLFLLIDQLEELFTLEAIDPAARAAFVRAIGALARSGLVWVVASMRSDFYHRCAEIPELVTLKEGAGQYDLLPPTFDEIGQMIVYPARAAGLRYESDTRTGERLDAVIHEAAARVPESLPLLSFTLDELYRRATSDRVLTFAAYRELGGLEGAIASRAEGVFAKLLPEIQATLPALIRSLATVDTATGTVVAAQRVPLAQAARSAPQRALLEALVAARLVVSDRAEDATPVVRVAHEALLSHWPRVADLIARDLEFLRVRARVAERAAHWNSETRQTDLLLPAGKPLAEAVELVAGRRSELDPLLVEYIDRSQARRQRRRLTQLVGAAVIAAGLTGVGVYSYFKWQEWQQRELLAETREDAARQQEAAAEREAALSRELQAKNRELERQNARRTKEMDFQKYWNAGGLHLFGGQGADAFEVYSQALPIAVELSEQPTDDQTTWIGRRIDVLGKLAESKFKAGHLDGGQKIVQERQAYLDGLNPDQREKLTGGSEKRNLPVGLNEHEITVVEMQFELVIANSHFVALLRQNELLKAALAERQGRPVPGKGPKIELRTPEEVAAARKRSLEATKKMVKQLAMGELLANSSKNVDHLWMLGRLYDSLEEAFAGDGDIESFEALHKRRVDFNREALRAREEQIANPANVANTTALERWRKEAGRIRLLLLDAWALRAKVQMNANDPEAAVASYREAVDAVDKAPAEQRSAGDAEKVAKVRFELADLLRRRGDGASAAEQMAAATAALVGQQTQSAHQSERNLIQGHMTVARENQKAGQVEAVRTHCQAALKLQRALVAETAADRDRDALFSLIGECAKLLAAQKDLAMALDLWREQLAIRRAQVDASSSFEFHERRAMLLLSLIPELKELPEESAATARELEQFLGDWKRALEADTSHARPVAGSWRDLSSILRRLGRNAEAVAARTKSVEVDEARLAAAPPDAGSQLESLYYDAAADCLNLGDLEAADRMLDKCRESLDRIPAERRDDGVRLQALRFASYVKRRRGALDAALDLARQALAIKLDVTDADLKKKRGRAICNLWLNLGRNLRDLNQPDLARDAVGRAAELAQRRTTLPQDFDLSMQETESPLMQAIEVWKEAGEVEADSERWDSAAAAYDKVVAFAEKILRPITNVEVLDSIARGLLRAAELRTLAARYDDAGKALEQAQSNCQRLADRVGDAESRRLLSRAWNAAGRLAAQGRNDAAAAAAAYLKAAETIEPLVRPDADPDRDRFAGYCLSASWYLLKSREFDQAAATALKARELYPPDARRAAMLSTNIAHGHLFAGRWDDAEKVYRQFRAAKVDDKRTFAQATLEDFAEFRKEGLTHPDMEKVEKLLAE